MKRRDFRRLAVECFEDRSVPAVFVVTTFADSVAADTTTGLDANGAVSLRSAVMAANAQAGTGPHSIELPAGNYSLTIAGADEEAAASGDLDIAGQVTITSTGATVDSTGIDRVFDIRPGATVFLSGLTMSDTAGGLAEGGVIRNAATLSLTDCGVSGSQKGPVIRGAGIYNTADGVFAMTGGSVSGTGVGLRGEDGNNGAVGSGPAGPGEGGSAGTDGGTVEGAAVYNAGGVVRLTGVAVNGSANAGDGGLGGNGGDGAAANAPTPRDRGRARAAAATAVTPAGPGSFQSAEPWKFPEEV